MPSTFDFSGAALPMPVRAARVILWTQAELILLGGAFRILTAIMFGAGALDNSPPPLLLGVILLGVGAAQVYAGVKLATTSMTTRNTAIAIAAGTALIMIPVVGWPAFLLPLALSAATIGLLLGPEEARAAFAAAPSGGPGESAAHESHLPAADAAEGAGESASA